MLQELLDKVEVGKFDRWSTAGLPFTGPQKSFITRAYNGSLDAAKALHEAVLPNYGYQVWQDDGSALVDVWDSEGISFVGGNLSASRAWLIAILRALIAQKEC